MDIPNTNTANALADYVISRFRKELGLWYDINDHAHGPKCLNEADLTDGRSYAFVRFSTKQSQESTVIVTEQLPPVYMSVLWRDDSRRMLETPDKTYRDLAAKAGHVFAELPDDRKYGPNISLLSFEVRQAVTGNRTREWLATIASQLGGNVQDVPRYGGRLADKPDFFVVEEPGSHWAQIALSQIVTEQEVASVLAPYIANAATFRAGTSKWYPGTPDFRVNFGISRLLILARRF